MTVLQALILGTIQGITEFLPVSSSGHLIFIPKIFGWADQGMGFDVVVHLGTLVAVVIYFRERLIEILKSVFDENLKYERKLGLYIILSIVPAGVVGLLFGDWIEENLRSSFVIGVGLVFWGLVLGLADWVGRKATENKLTLKKSIFIACAQAMALVPGTSRSGITMTAGLFSKLDKKTAAEFSFLVSVPIIFLAGGLKVSEMLGEGLGNMSWSVLSIGFVASAISGFVAIWGLMKIIEKWSFRPFVIYRVVVGILVLLFLV